MSTLTSLSAVAPVTRPVNDLDELSATLIQTRETLSCVSENCLNLTQAWLEMALQASTTLSRVTTEAGQAWINSWAQALQYVAEASGDAMACTSLYDVIALPADQMARLTKMAEGATARYAHLYDTATRGGEALASLTSAISEQALQTAIEAPLNHPIRLRDVA
ncbi:hypothetical protein AEAC466_17075 [Asticcacaulis sp. AC466]|uniref:hypothetical protein n=1 Tax=Asticcacaulis sp. AC466 TaxID=1282362 RepID=UPI0003C4041B|nr:hypothetical protein [Asticcacaulis sp. AC466]ESQ82579.1 hypothetical protein AEAC466_17075 [Asticcacaulis sp. AC466]